MSGVSRWCIRFHPCLVSVCVSDQEWFCDSLRGLNPVKVMVLELKMVLGYLLSPGYEGHLE
ncbi:hypothetical protein DY000_02009747 [Brassica cretica]|uniref:Uncharacterized protein n=1 Tax=Brassica cretica TaxID=69181 RepID=A0ABQ7C7X6_BRACR|nr:hypothetical protein DY000_02009747 [Brassica cretica]